MDIKTSKYVALGVSILVILAFSVPVRYKIEPGQIEVTPDKKLTGKFIVRFKPILELKEDFPFFIVNQGTNPLKGGACLAVLTKDVLTDGGPECFKDDQCPDGGFTGSGYCDVNNNTCWLRPGPGTTYKDPPDDNSDSAPFCHRSVDYPPNPGKTWPAGDYPANRESLDITKIDTTKINIEPNSLVHWRIITCHSINRVCHHSFGPVMEVNINE